MEVVVLEFYRALGLSLITICSVLVLGTWWHSMEFALGVLVAALVIGLGVLFWLER